MSPAVLEAGVERVVLDMLGELGWMTAYGPEIGPGTPAAERDDYREVVLTRRLRSAVVRLNPGLPDEAVEDVVATVLRPESPVAESENWRAYQLLTDGVPVEYRAGDGALKSVRARLVDFDRPAANDLLAVNQFTIRGASERRPDLLLFVNGLPLVLAELKRPGEDNATLTGAFHQIQTYRREIPDVFTWNQLVVISDGVGARAGSFTAPWRHFMTWKTIDGRQLAPEGWAQYEVLVAGMLAPGVLLDLVRQFVAVYGEGVQMRKLVAKYHQYWAVRKAVERTVDAVDDDGRAGVVWHTQGSGKSLEMLCYAGAIMRHPAMDNPTIVVLTDRNDLDDQLHDEVFAAANVGAPLPEAPVQADSREHLKDLLAARESGGVVFATIQKFGRSRADREAGRSFPTLSRRPNIVVMVDEAHRSNYDFVDGFARHLRDALPNATKIGFTGTPIERDDRSTRAVFGDDIDIYDLTQAVDDGATVKVYYEPRLARVELPEDAGADLDEAFAEATTGSEDEARERLKTRWARVEAIVGSDKRIAELGRDIVAHWEKRRRDVPGKAMVVTMSRRIAAALYDEIVALRPDWHSDADDEGVVKVVVTGSASDPAELQPHIRSKRARSAIKRRAKDVDDPLQIVIVRDMWLTGFDSPPMHTMYVDKPMRGAPLMQAIARVNRTFAGKESGLVVDYLGIAEDLKSALADYTKRDRDNEEMGEDLRERAIPALHEEHEVACSILHDYPWRETLAAGGDRAYVRALSGAVDWLLGQHPGSAHAPCTSETPCAKCRFMDHARKLRSIYAVCVPDERALAIREDVAFLDAVRGQIAKQEGVGQRGVDPAAERDAAIKQIVSDHVSGAGVLDIYAEAGLERPDLLLIDEGFVDAFRRSDRPNLQLELLKRLLGDEIKTMSRRNVVQGRKFSELLRASLLRYQNRSIDAAAVVTELVALAQEMKAEDERGRASGMNEAELAFYDAIAGDRSAAGELGDDELRTIAHELVGALRQDAKTDWNVKEQVRAKMRAAIKRLLLRHGYPPDKEAEVTELIFAQAEALTTLAA